ncbi:MAG: STAS domain-containing protein [Planctomycetota bacterium]|jgi:anti-sigma B factor antagonist
MEPTESKIFVEHYPDVTTITFMHENVLTEEYIKGLEESIMSVVEQARRQNLVLDFGNVKFLSSAVLGLLIKVHKKICQRKGHLQLCNISPDIYKVFEITRLNKVFDISTKKQESGL